MSILFSPCTLGECSISNRIVIPPMCQYAAHNGQAGPWHTMHYGTLAASGAGLLIVEATSVTPEGRIGVHDLGLWSEDTEASLRQMLDNIRPWASMPLFVQLAHAGRKAAHATPWQGGKPLSPEEGGWECSSPSCLPYDSHTPAPHSLDASGMEAVLQAFIQAAQRANRAGFDGIEIHAAHGYLLHQFLSPLANTRTDAFGGSLDNRMRFPLEIFKRVRDAFPENKAVGIRISATDFTPGGWNLEDSIAFSQKCKALGCAYVHVSGGGLSCEQSITPCPGYQVSYAAAIKEELNMPTIAVGLISHPDQAETILATRQADMVAIGRAMLYNPRWPWHAAAHLGAQISAPPQYWRSAPHGVKNLFAI